MTPAPLEDRQPEGAILGDIGHSEALNQEHQATEAAVMRLRRLLGEEVQAANEKVAHERTLRLHAEADLEGAIADLERVARWARKAVHPDKIAAEADRAVRVLRKHGGR